MERMSIDRALEVLNEAGIPIKKYAKAPVGVNTFIVGVGDRYKENERICIWPGLVEEAGVSVDKSIPQAVLNVYEEGREHRFNVIRSVSVKASESEDVLIKRVVSYATNDYIKNSPTFGSIVSWPEGTKLVSVVPAVSGSLKEALTKGRVDYYGDLPFTVTIKTPSEVRSFLIGYDHDGDNVFISLLPRTANSVEEAHEILRPDGVPKDALRQGEFFFIPVPELDTIQQLSEDPVLKKIVSRSIGYATRKDNAHYICNKQGAITDHRLYKGRWIEIDNYDVELGDTIFKTFVKGVVKNARHEDLHLETWHEVITNNEQPNPGVTRWD